MRGYMSKILFEFDIVPSFFRKNGWFQSDNTFKFVSWCFSRCSSVEKDVFHDNQTLRMKPFQFIFGRYKCSEQTNMSEMEVRTQQNLMEKSGLLKKSPNKTPNRFTIYEWVTERFSENNNQVNNQQTTNKQPTNNHKQEEQILDAKNNNVECEGCRFFDCLLQDTRLDEDDRKSLMKYPEERVIAAIEYSHEVKAKKSLMAQLVWFCTTKKPPQIINNQDVKKNKSLAKKIENIDHPYKFEASKDSLLIIKGVTGIQEEVLYKESHENFCKEIERIAKIKI